MSIYGMNRHKRKNQTRTAGLETRLRNAVFWRGDLCLN